LERGNQRWKWLGALRRRATLELLSRMRLVVVPSRAEGGPNVISEAIALEKPVLATRIEGTMGLLGREHPGLFEVGDATGLRRLIERCEESASFLSELTRASRERLPLFDAEQERRAWSDLLGELGVVP
jgi:glycosyltransferase involved in cell wall biosynthesis